MKKVELLIVCMSIGFTVVAQSDFIAPGAKWTFEAADYNWHVPPHPKISYKMLEYNYVGDTLIGGYTYKHIVGDTHPWLLREEDSVIYYLHPQDQTQRVYWDFNAGVGDTFHLLTHKFADPVVGVVDSIYTQDINGVESKVFASRFWLMMDPLDKLDLLFNARFGPMDNSLWILQTINFLTDECWNCHTLRCYEDDEMPLYNPVGIPCDSIRPGTTSVQPIDPGGRPIFTIYPNPASDLVVVEFKEGVGKLRVNIRHLSGAIVFSQELAPAMPSLQLSVSHLTAGMYHFEVHEESRGLLGSEKLIIAR
jgi:hypothetical protein